MSEQHTNSLLKLLPLLTRKAICDAFGMKRITFYRKTKSLNLPSGKIVHDDSVKICEHLRRDIRLLEEHSKKYII